MATDRPCLVDGRRLGIAHPTQTFVAAWSCNHVDEVGCHRSPATRPGGVSLWGPTADQQWDELLPSVSKLLGLMGPAGLVVQALLASLAAVVGLLIFILLRRGARRVYFWRRDRRVLEARADWNAIVDGTVTSESMGAEPDEPRNCRRHPAGPS